MGVQVPFCKDASPSLRLHDRSSVKVPLYAGTGYAGEGLAAGDDRSSWTNFKLGTLVF
jgi:hypothetical protein